MKLKELFIKADTRIIEYFEANPKPNLRKFIKIFSINPKVTYILFLTVNFFAFDNKFLKNIICLLFFDVCIWILKRIIRRQRPEKYNTGLMHQLSGLGPDAYSFPSAHTFTAFQIIPFSILMFNIFGIFVVLYSALVASSRVILKHHYFSDIFAGAVLGLICGTINVLIL